VDGTLTHEVSARTRAGLQHPIPVSSLPYIGSGARPGNRVVGVQQTPVPSTVAVPPGEARSPFPGTGLVTSFPAESGHGRVALELDRLGLLESLVFFKTRPKDSEAGFRRVVKPRFNPAGSAVFASLYVRSIWSRDIRRYSWAHLCSPHFFHLVHDNPNLTGIVHDVGYLDSRKLSRSPVGYRFLFAKEMALASKLRGVVSVSAITRDRLERINPEVRPMVIHNWTGGEFRFREKITARRLLGLPEEPTLILSVGLDVPRKNLDLLPRLLRRLGPGYLVLRIGPSARIAPAFPPQTLLAFPSVPGDLYPIFFNAADLLVYPSLDEGFGVPLIEAINSSTPVVASDIPIFREVMRRTDCLVPLDDLAGWVELCRAAARIGPDRRREGRLFPELGNYYRPERALRQYLDFFHQAGLS
jgi:glycosyltransferase involved in cell wall biosynthesis